MEGVACGIVCTQVELDSDMLAHIRQNIVTGTVT